MVDLHELVLEQDKNDRISRETKLINEICQWIMSGCGEADVTRLLNQYQLDCAKYLTRLMDKNM